MNVFEYIKQLFVSKSNNPRSVKAQEEKKYQELNEEYKNTGKKCNDINCGFPECTRCSGYQTPYCRFGATD